MSTKASVGQIVHVFADPNENNGADVAPAIITRAWSDDLVNVRVLGDNAGPPEWKTSIKIFDTREEAAESNLRFVPIVDGTIKGSNISKVPFAAFWPPRT